MRYFFYFLLMTLFACSPPLSKHHLLVIGDSATLGNDRFYADFTQHCESTGAYRSCWEWA